MGGLQNRFSSSTREVWWGWYECMLCGRNGIEDLHHILSPATRGYIGGEHNRSVLNSSPLHNRVCHIGNDYKLHAMVSQLLDKTVMALDFLNYRLKPRDILFFQTYKHLYGKQAIKVIESMSKGL